MENSAYWVFSGDKTWFWWKFEGRIWNIWGYWNFSKRQLKPNRTDVKRNGEEAKILTKNTADSSWLWWRIKLLRFVATESILNGDDKFGLL